MIVFPAFQKVIRPFMISPKELSRLGSNVRVDSFEHTISQKEIYMKELKKLFPENTLFNLYSKMNKDFGIDYPARLTFFANPASKSNYHFERNTIGLNLMDCLDREYKIVEKTKSGDKTVFSMVSNMPLFLKSDEAQEVFQSKYGEGFELVRLTPFEKRKYVLQTLAHNVIHSQQFMLMRQTKNLGAGEVLYAKTNLKNFNQNRKQIGEQLIKGTFWDKHQTKETFEYESSFGRQALVWLSDLTSTKGQEFSFKMENDANTRAYNYIKATFGDY